MATSITYIFMRHGEAEHNVAAARDGDSAYLNPKYRDAPLTAKGREQILESARELAKIYPKINAIISSPLTRAIQTARCVTEIIPYTEKIILSESLTECQGGGHICNHRMEMPLLQDMNPDTDATWINEAYYAWQVSQALNRPRESESSMQWRGYNFVNTLHGRHLKHIPLPKEGPITILMISHHETLNAWFGKSLKNGEYLVVNDLQKIRTPHNRHTWATQ